MPRKEHQVKQHTVRLPAPLTSDLNTIKLALTLGRRCCLRQGLRFFL
jgi:hypothetical protein